jgi:glycosyltransferase involved in cell wall biosynthesis
MKIAIDCRMLGMSGIGIVLKTILDNLPLCHQYVLIGDKNKLCKYTANKIIECFIPIFSLKEYFLYPVLTVNKCDAFFTPNWNIPSRIKVPIYSMIHDVISLDCSDINTKISKIVSYLLLRRALHISKYVFTVSEFSKQRLISFFHLSNKIIVLYNDVTNEVKYFDNNKTKQLSNYFLYIGNIKRHKGIKILIQAFKKMNINDLLYIVGKKEGFRTSDTEISTNYQNVIFTGNIQSQDVYELLYNAKALIQPSFYEGFGLAPLEALWLKTPVILSDIPVFKEIYGELPVTFFETGNSDDLVDKMRHIHKVDYDPWIVLKKFNATKNVEMLLKAMNYDERHND